MKIAIVSDCHDNFENLDRVIKIANKNKCTHLLFAGDFISPQGLQSFKKFKGSVEMVWGNNEGEKVGFVESVRKMENVTIHGDIYEGEINGLKIFMNHYPRISEMAAKTGEFDLVIHGHTHIYRKEGVDSTLLINPGNIKGNREDAGFVIFNTEDRGIQRISIE